jgi:exosortase D (VPLPA-CTERM-specific)
MSNVQLRSPLPGYALVAVAFAGALVLFASAIAQLYTVWNAQPEYSYGILIPFLSAFLIYRERDQLRGLPFTGSWYGLLLIVLGLGLRFVGELSTMPAVVHYALLLVLYGLVLALAGPTVFRRLFMPLLILVFMVPLPPLVTTQLSLQLQLLSSQLGVWVIRAFGISVLLEGNVIDLGTYKLEVAEACSGLRYLFPLMTLSFIVAYLFRGALWKRAIVFLSSIPITVIMNSLRIGLIGVTVDRWGTAMAEGVLHEFEGWVMFMASSAVVVLLAITLTKSRNRTITPATGSLAAARTATPPASVAIAPSVPFQSLPKSFVAAIVVLVSGATLEYTTPERPEIAPSRMEFVDFPSHFGQWQEASRDRLDQVYLDALLLDDYLLTNYRDPAGLPVNFYVAYYRSQRNGMSVHSPRLCLPGGGWNILSFEQHQIPGTVGRASWPVNRVIIEQGGQQQLVYYWFRERGKRLTNEYTVRWYLFWDALKMHRTDGALVRLVVPVPKGTNAASLDAELTSFASLTEETLARYVPD